MSSLSNAKVLGGVGGILSIFPFASVVGWILITIAMKELGDHTQDRTIRDDGLMGAITALISSIILAVAIATGALGAIVAIPLGITTNLTSDAFLADFAIYVAFCVFAIISGIFLKRAYDGTAKQLKMGQFATAGLLYLIGGLTSIIFVGFLLFFIAFIFMIVAYFSIQDRPPPIYYGFQPPQPVAPPSLQPVQPAVPQSPPAQPQPAPPQPVQPPAMQPQSVPQPTQAPMSKFCFMCGVKLPGNAIFCTNCGTKQP
jgi:uncharacterized membrane protein